MYRAALPSPLLTRKKEYKFLFVFPNNVWFYPLKQNTFETPERNILLILDFAFWWERAIIRSLSCQ